MTYRTTKQEQMILSITQAHYDHPTADTIYAEVRAINKHISRGTVYRNLEKLCETGHLLRVKVPGTADRFDRMLDYHYHFICTNCERVFNAPLEYQTNIDSILAKNSNFKITRHRTVFEGLCEDCAKKQSNNKQS